MNIWIADSSIYFVLIFLLHCSRRWYQNKTPALTKQTDFGSTALDIRRRFADINTYFSFASNDLAVALGFKQDTFPLLQPSYPILNYTFQDNISLLAASAFFLKFNADSYIVELLNIKINSMDAMSNQHKNFLAVIPHSDTIVERVTYLAPVLLWIDLNNKEPLNLRQIKARIIQQDLSPIFCYGTSQLVLLIE